MSKLVFEAYHPERCPKSSYLSPRPLLFTQLYLQSEQEVTHVPAQDPHRARNEASTRYSNAAALATEA